MVAKLTTELAEALLVSGETGLEVVDPATSRVYVILDSETHRRAMDALRRQTDREAIAEGLAQFESGAGTPLEEALANVRARLGLGPKS